MNRTAFAVLVLLSSCTTPTQYDPSNIFAHNDYVRAVPFFTAYNLGVGYIEADVFLKDGALSVAHHERDIVPDRTLEALYLQPLQKKIQDNNGTVYDDSKSALTLMIDLKTEGVSTLSALVALLGEYPALTSCPTLTIMISGNVPDPARWSEYPLYIFIDGRPGIAYTAEQLKRVCMISTNFNDHVKWDGRGKISGEGRQKIQALLQDAHAKGKTFRFWATPDFKEAWQELMVLDMDVIVTDDVTGLSEFLKEKK
jgi:alkaline phosphatase